MPNIPNMPTKQQLQKWLSLHFLTYGSERCFLMLIPRLAAWLAIKQTAFNAPSIIMHAIRIGKHIRHSPIEAAPIPESGSGIRA